MLASFVDLLLEALTGQPQLYPRPYESMYHFAKRLKEMKRRQFCSSVWQMERQGLIEIVKKNNTKFIKCTKKGQLEILLKKAVMKKPSVWDGKWRIVVFDIPEESKAKRNLLRWLLKKNGYNKLQASVYINPYPLNREAIKYLQETKLIDFIRIIKVEEMDNDTDLRKKFNLK
ncbi:MAG: CRISPR-associated endonuclease Cas2 [Patescibacteria group bacterium]|nr:CRISPR-associated endonuclease Cas2 [Patescibacteria group bacterium]